jgi:DNA-binding IclR family transcriptional regulator
MRETTLRRGLKLLVELGSVSTEAGQGVTVSRLAERLQLHPSQVSRTLQVLQEEGFIERRLDRGYQLSWRVYVLGRQVSGRLLSESTDACLSALVESIGERCYLAVLQGATVLTVQSKSPGFGVEVADWVGHSRPAHATSSGRALLVDSTQTELRDFFRASTFSPVGPSSPLTIEDLYTRIEAARRKGYALADEEIEPGVLSAAVPIRNGGTVIAALGFAAPKFRMGKQQLAQSVTRLIVAGRELSSEIARQSTIESGGSFTQPITHASQDAKTAEGVWR